MDKRWRAAVLACATVGLSACTASTTFHSPQSGTEVAVKETTATAVPRTEKLNTTSFGNYEFSARSPGLEPLTGILPLDFKGEYLALDILFFAPAMFFNLREPYAHYEFDLVERVVRYRRKESDAWSVYTPTAEEQARGQRYFAVPATGPDTAGPAAGAAQNK
jgi:hypothetical protein